MEIFTFEVTADDYRDKYMRAINDASTRRADVGFSGFVKDRVPYITVVTNKTALQDIADAIEATPEEKERIQAL